jgi:selenocysteine lyase/cysteine desulfurase
MDGPFPRRRFLSSLALPGVGMAALPPKLVAAPAGPFAPPPDVSDERVFADARREFLIPEGVAYCNTGTLGASPREVVEELASQTARLESELADWDYTRVDGEPLTGYQPLVAARAAVGALAGAPADEVALTQNATMGMGFLAAGLDLEPGDEVLTTDQEHVGGVCPWRLQAKRRGVVVKELPLLPALTSPESVVRLFADAVTPRTRVVVFSHVTSSLGILLPARELCALARERGALAIVDGAQAVGQIPVDVKQLGCDAYVASPHKWLLAPKGTGFLYVRREVQDRFWTTLASTFWDDREKAAFRFMQYGTGSVPLVHALLASVRFVERLGLDRIARWDAALTRRLRDGLAGIPAVRLASPADPRFTAAISTFRVEGVTGRALQDALWTRRIRVRSQGDEKGVRLSAHLYVGPQDIDRAIEAVAALKPA